ncbi:class I SAM-dependent methyltransferase [Dankookia rubra]|uniref:Class I SAM-dependent methyltransferase n=1 Tax=Dankookia rubra TaxID=1442381 RepID=A0A4R5QA01_9PROT|nr:class I SAM-dependent methyltransferase [Dankookia rubra]TDH59586.1 class I SAM-dependent methyltransferase [Dankookia rubra]
MAISTSTAPTGAEPPLPPCPITGEPAAERIEAVSAKLLTDLWRFGAGVAPTPLHRSAGPLGLYRSPCGLRFFHPPVPGDAAFYGAFYGRHRALEQFSAHAAERGDFRAAAALVQAGDRVLDVGCGDGAFAALVPQAAYQGLDLHPLRRPGGPPILAETVEAHAGRHPAAYDLVAGFQVLEHVADPLGLARAMLRCVRPGGLLVAAMPLYPSPLTAFPNNLLNLPPHHLSWWTEEACAALCRALGAEPVSIGPVPSSTMHARMQWMARLCPLPRPGRPGRAHVRRGWGTQAAVWLGFQAAGLAAAVAGLPRRAAPIDVVLVARNAAR